MLEIISILCILLLFAIAFVFFESKRECSNIKLTKYSILNEKINKKGINILMMADVHNSLGNKDMELFWKELEKNKPDVIILAGDMVVDHFDQGDENCETAKFINKLASYADVYYGMGNHERALMKPVKKCQGLWDRYTSELIPQIKLMDDKKYTICAKGNTINIYGLNLELDYYKRFVEKKLDVDELDRRLGKPEKNGYNILIAHNPDYFEKYVAWGADMIFSGHNHGGLVKLPILGGVISPRLRLFPRYDYGIYKSNGKTMILTNGVGAHSLKLRVNNIPEIVFVNIKIDDN